MGKILLVLLLFNFHVISSLSTNLPSPSLNSAPLCLPKESSALLQFKSSLSLANYSRCLGTYPKTNSWNETTNCCLWEGVTCDNLTAHVVALDLSCSSLIGPLSASSSLFLLQQLQQLNLAYNYFDGSLSSDILSGLVSLTHLNLSGNGFSGLIPSGFFSQLVSLTHLDLSFNQFSGLVPPEISLLSELVSLDLSVASFRNDYNFTIDKYSYDMLARNLSKLIDLFFDGVNMSSVPPSFLLNFTSSLKRLSLRSCLLRGELPAEVFRFRHLQYLDLSSNGDLTGLLPKSNWSSPVELLDISDCAFGGPLPASLGNLTQIVSLGLAPNNFEGGIPDVFGSLSKLGRLDLLSSNFSGPLPLTIFNLTQVTFLDLSYNSLEGELPVHVSGLQNLEYLDLSRNLISGAVPSWLFALPSLNALDLSNNKLLTLPPDNQIQKPNSILQKINLGSNEIHGSIPSFFFDFVNLIDLNLSSNNLSGSIPSFFFDFVNLTDLDLSSNNLSGVITSEMLSKPRRLQTLSLAKNSLLSLSSNADIDFNYTFLELNFSYCNIRRFPNFLRTGKNLTSLDLSNNKIEGSISKWESEGWEQLTDLDLSNNSLTSFEQYPGQNLVTLNVRSNQLHGPLLAPPPSVQEFSISNNRLTGEIPSLICNLSSPRVLDLSMNDLGGVIPACLANFALQTIYLQKNNFHGQIPAFDGRRLQTLALNDNQLEGLLPQTLVNCSSLEYLNVANNKINDTFPQRLGTLPVLKVIVLRGNRFHGPVENAIAPSSSSKLEIIDLSQNVFTGALPSNFLLNLTAMKFEDRTQIEDCDQSIFIPRCYFKALGDRFHDDSPKSVKVMIKRLQLEIQVGGKLSGFKIIDFSNNQFYGRIPDVLGELGLLQVLNLSHNQFTGSIPPLLGHMEALESLDLSSNKLRGRIPLELTNLTFLEVLNLSQNNLIGPIPQGKQFSTFENDSYSGNPGLWGCPLSKKCGSLPQPPPARILNQDGDDEAFIWKVAGMGYGCGLVLGLSMGYIVFTTGRPWWIVRKIERDWQKNVTNWIRRIRGRRN